MEKSYLSLDGSQPSSLGCFSPFCQTFRKLRCVDFWFEVSVIWPPNSLNCYHSSVMLTIGLFLSFQFCIQRFINFVVKLGKFPCLPPLGRVWGLPRRHSDKASTCRRCERLGFDPGWGRSPGVGNGNALQYSCLENNRMDRGAWRATFHGVAKSWTRLSNEHTHWESFRESDEALSSLFPRVQQDAF